MIRTRLLGALASVAALAAASGSEAQTVDVRTGQHADFTRLVVDFAARPGWRLDRVAGGYRLVLDGPTPEYDLSDAFRRIDRARIAAIEQTPRGLEIRTACDCSAETVELPNQGLVIDITDVPPDAPVASPAAVVVPDRAPAGAASGPRSEDAATDDLLPGLLTASTFPDPGEAERRRLRERARSVLAGELARGASQGVVTVRRGPTSDYAPSDDAPPRSDRGGDPDAATPTAPPGPDDGADDAGPDRDALDHANLRIETALDRARPRPTPRQARHCWPASTADVASWVPPTSQADTLRIDVGTLYDDVGRPDVAAHLDQARRMVWRGFGAEARAVLRSGGLDSEQAALIDEIAMLVDGDAMGRATLIAQRGCETPAALWAMLADPPPEPGDDIADDGIVAAHAALPAHLRRHIGPRLTARLLAQGRRDTALAIAAAVDRLPGAPAGDAAMMSARIALDGPRPDAADPILDAVATGTGPDAAMAAISRIDARIAAMAPVGAEIVAEAELLAFERRGTDVEPLLLAAALRASIHDGDLATAFDRLGNPALADEARADLRDDALEALAVLPDDATFLRLALSRLEAPIRREETRLAISERLVAMGVTDAARAVLGSDAAIPSRRERIVRADIAIAENRPDIAEAYLTGLDGAAMDDRRRRIGLLTASRQADSAQPAPSADETGAPPSEALPPLARNRSVLDAARAARADLSTLLGE